MPLRWDHHGVPHDTQNSRATPEHPQIDGVVVLSRRSWGVGAQREVLDDAVTLVDTLLRREPPRSTSLDLFHRGLSRLPQRANVDEQRRSSMESLRTSLNELCRRRSTHADFDATLVDPGRTHRPNAPNALPGRSRLWRCRAENNVQENGLEVSRSQMSKRLSQQGFTDDQAPTRSQDADENPTPQPNSDAGEIEAPEQSSSASTSTDSVVAQPGNPEDIIRNQLECPVCLDYLSPPIKQCANGHCVCSSCSPRMSHCGTCRASFITTTNVVLENLVRSLCFPCRHRDAGCSEILKMEERPSHEVVCRFRPRKCPCCDWQGPLEDVKPHMCSSHECHVMRLGEYREFSFAVDGVQDEQFVVFIDSETFVFESNYDLWRSKLFAEVRRVTDSPIEGDTCFVFDVELYTKSKTAHMKLRNPVNEESDPPIKIDLDVFNQFVINDQYKMHMRITTQ